MRAIARAAFLHGLWCGGFTMGSAINTVNSLALALAGDGVYSAATFIVAVVMARMALREWRLHRAGLVNLGGTGS